MNAVRLLPGNRSGLYLFNAIIGEPDASGKIVIDPLGDFAAFAAMKAYYHYCDDEDIKRELRVELAKWAESWKRVEEAEYASEGD